MFTVKYRGMRIDLTYSAMQELAQESKTLYFVLKILEEGYDAPRKRKKGIIEKWFDKENKTYNAVIAQDYDDITKEDVWKLIHFGKFGRK